MVHDTYKTAKINFMNSGAVNIIRTAYYSHGPELMKLIFCGFICVMNVDFCWPDYISSVICFGRLGIVSICKSIW